LRQSLTLSSKKSQKKNFFRCNKQQLLRGLQGRKMIRKHLLQKRLLVSQRQERVVQVNWQLLKATYPYPVQALSLSSSLWITE
jgi:hypothetical protein